MYILHIVYFTYYIFAYITFSFPYDDDGDEDKLRKTDYDDVDDDQ